MSELTFTETVRIVAGINECAGWAQEIRAQFDVASPDDLWSCLGMAINLATRVQTILPESPAKVPDDTTYKYLSGAVAACRKRLDVITGLRAELDEVADEAALLSLIRRARDLARELHGAALAGLDLALDATTDEGVES